MIEMTELTLTGITKITLNLSDDEILELGKALKYYKTEIESYEPYYNKNNKHLVHIRIKNIQSVINILNEEL